MNIEWTHELETGIDIIDEDHRNIIEFYNKIYQYYDCSDDEVLLERAITDFRFSFTIHFLKEENFMAELKYPDFDSHAKEHQIMNDLLNKFSHTTMNKEDSCHKIAFLVIQWISSHLEGSDRRLAEFARQHAQVKQV